MLTDLLSYSPIIFIFILKLSDKRKIAVFSDEINLDFLVW